MAASMPMTIDRRSFLAGAAATGVAAAGLGTLGTGVASAVNRYPLPTGSSALRVLVTGDAGTGEKPQYAVTDAARKLHAAKPFDVALGLGDNIYETGPDGPDDKQFQNKFEKPNAGLDFPWLMTLGNHDNTAIFPGDGGWLLRGNTEVEYHKRSRRWYMPQRYYSVSLGVVDFFIVDLNPLAAYIPPFLSPEWNPDGHYMTAQGKWLDKSLAASKAPWKIVCTHHAYVSNGSHGPAGDYDGLPAPMNGIEAKRFIEKHIAGRANFLFSGHDHSQQVFENVAGLKGTRQIVSGAAAKSTSKPSTKRFRSKYENHQDRGFMTLDVDSSSLKLSAYEVKANAPGAREAFTTTFRR
ncbi:MAG: metallophosphoesterase [Gordonia sp. (in: high G+C Gram-positive bacteria)]